MHSVNLKKVDWRQALQQFIWHKTAQGLAEKTLKDYQNHVERFFKRFPDAWPDKLKEAINIYMAERVKPATYNLRLVYLKAFFNYCVEEEYIDDNPLKKFKRKKTEIKFININTDTLQELLKLPDRKTYAGLRDYTLILLTLDTAIRPSEALQLIPADIDLKNLTVTVRAEISKTRTTRILPITPVTAEALNKLLAVRPREWLHSPVFCNQDGQPMLETSWNHKLQNYSRKLGLKINAYSLRHVAATEFLRGGGDIHSLRYLLGHSGLEMAIKYVHLVEQDIKDKHTTASVVQRMFSRKRIRNI